MKIHEYQAKTILSSYGIPVDDYILCNRVEEVPEAYRKLGPEKAVIKAQVLTGGRGKAGGVKIVNNAGEALQEAKRIFGMNIKGFMVEKVIVSKAVAIAKEYYVSFTIDRNTRSVLLMMSASGGMEIEEVAKISPEKIHRFHIDPFTGLPAYKARELAFLLFNSIDQVNQMTAILQELYRLFVEQDASLVEINPLVKTTGGDLLAIDAKMTFDDNALYRHPAIKMLAEPDEDEKTEAYAREKGFSYVRMEGKIGCMVNGAGLAMATMDMIQLYGGKPANFLDIGGSSNPQKVIDAMSLLLKDKNVNVVLINIFGGITRCDDVAKGLLEAFKTIQSTIPVVVRLTGTNEQEGRDLLKGSRFQVAETMSEATGIAVKISQSHKKEQL